jgi:hypothetical protein
MTFCFEWLAPTDDPVIALGRIEIGDFSEHFRIVTSYWDRVAYETQWKTAIRHLLDGATNSCLIQSMGNPALATYLFWWPMYRLEGDVVAVQNHILFLEELSEPFDPGDPYRFIHARETVDEDGDRISEWQTTLTDLAEFERGLLPQRTVTRP